MKIFQTFRFNFEIEILEICELLLLFIFWSLFCLYVRKKMVNYVWGRIWQLKKIIFIHYYWFCVLQLNISFCDCLFLKYMLSPFLGISSTKLYFEDSWSTFLCFLCVPSNCLHIISSVLCYWSSYEMNCRHPVTPNKVSKSDGGACISISISISCQVIHSNNTR